MMPAVLIGFLAVALLIPGAGALQCYKSSSLLHYSAWGKLSSAFETPNRTISCTPAQGACVEVLVTLTTGMAVIVATHRGCSSGAAKDGAVSTPSDNQPFVIQSHMRYCHTELCNVQATSNTIPRKPGKGKASDPAGSHLCFSSLGLDPHPGSLERVTCNEGYTRCYQGNGTITVGELSMPIFIRTCQNPACAVPPSQHFGPVQLRQEGFCCLGSYCNREAAAMHVKSTNYSASPGVYNTSTATYEYSDAGSRTPYSTDFTKPPWSNIPSKEPPNVSFDDEEEEEEEEAFDDNKSPKATVFPRAHHTQHPRDNGPSLQFCPLLAVLWMATLGL
uniref:UPAR/Ly6 domain-containing protein n=1 Tax=Sphenodon punctatus TaxID=8508 RepID=A0A8D0HA27_SPHPU